MYFWRNKQSDEATSEIEVSSEKPEDGEMMERKAFSAYAQESGLPSTSSEWPSNSPLLVVPSNRASGIEYEVPPNETVLDDRESSLNALPMNGCAVPFDGPLFSGNLKSRMVGVSSRQAGDADNRMSNQEYFQNRSRQYQWSVQGRFKKRTRFDKVVTGQDFGRPFRNAPSSRVVKRGLDLLKHKLPETFDCDLLSDEPRFEHPLLAGCQYFRIDRPEDMERHSGDDFYGMGDDGNIIEDTSLLGDESVPQDGVARRKYFSKSSNLDRYYFEPDLVYTFDFFANFFSPVRHRLELTPFFSVDLVPYFNGYPLFMSMAKEKDTGEYLWATEMWHQRLLDWAVGSPGRFFARLFASKSQTEDAYETSECETEVD